MIINASHLHFMQKKHFITHLITGDATVLWKQGERVIYADKVHIGRELRASIVDGTSLLLRGVDTQYTGKLIHNFVPKVTKSLAF